MPLNMLLSVIIPCLNEAPICASRLEALQFLRQEGHELVLVDGGSTDGTADVARPLVDRLLTSAPGRAIQMNRGAGAARGAVLWFLHLDTELSAGAVEQVVEGRAERVDIRRGRDLADLPAGLILNTLRQRLTWLLRGLLRLCARVFVGPGVRLRGKSSLQIGRYATLDRGCQIDGYVALRALHALGPGPAKAKIRKTEACVHADIGRG